MKRLFSCVCAFVAAFILMSMTGVVTASASTGSIDTSHAKDGFVTVNYASDSKLKVGIQYGDCRILSGSGRWHIHHYRM